MKNGETFQSTNFPAFYNNSEWLCWTFTAFENQVVLFFVMSEVSGAVSKPRKWEFTIQYLMRIQSQATIILSSS